MTSSKEQSTSSPNSLKRTKVGRVTMHDTLLLRVEERLTPPTHVIHLTKNLIFKKKLNSGEVPHRGATELARTLRAFWFIKRCENWRSDCWEEFHFELEFKDVAEVANMSMMHIMMV